MKDYILLFFELVLFVVICSILLALPVMLLWNWLMPIIFGLGKINLFQAFGLSLLFRFLFPSTKSKTDN